MRFTESEKKLIKKMLEEDESVKTISQLIRKAFLKYAKNNVKEDI